MPKVKAWSVAAPQILDKKLRPDMPAHMREVVIKEAEHRALIDTFGEGFKFGSDGKPQEQGIGSMAWYAQASAEEYERTQKQTLQGVIVWAFIDTGRVSQRTACEQINARLRLIKLIGKACWPVSGYRQRGNKLMTVHLQLVRPSNENRSVRTSACICAAY